MWSVPQPLPNPPSLGDPMKRCFRPLAVLAATAVSLAALAQSPGAQSPRHLTLTADTSKPGIPIVPDFLGLSFETADILPKPDGTYPYFRASNHDLVNLFQTIGVKSLRIGGNTSDRPTVNVPNTRDIDELFQFAHAAGTQVIYTLRMRQSTPEQDAPLARYLMSHYGSSISCLVVGNEPDVYEKEYSRYRDDLRRFLGAILVPGVAPNAKICGPSTTPNKAEWANQFVADFGPTGHVLWVTQHSYPAGNGKTITDPPAERDKILSPDFSQHYQKLADEFVPAVEQAHLHYRIEETNSYYNGGAKDVSNSFASSLWALDYLYWWAAHHSQGVNFHTGDFVAAGPQQTICWYGIFHTLPTGGYEIRPIAYAMKAFSLTAHGSLAPLSGLPPSSAVHGYAVADPGTRTLYLVLIDAEHGSQANPVTVALNPGTKYPRAESMLLEAPDGNIAATTGIRLGGSEIRGDGSWTGKWSPLPLRGGHLTVDLRPATALLIKVPLRQ
jgi:hypothetical protein